ncbi:hypothetical protein [Nocardioides pacificus]
MNADLLPLHMGSLHAYEQVLVVLLAFGPFVALGVVAVFLRRRDAREAEAASQEPTVPPAQPSGPAPPAQPSRNG